MALVAIRRRVTSGGHPRLEEENIFVLTFMRWGIRRAELRTASVVQDLASLLTPDLTKLPESARFSALSNVYWVRDHLPEGATWEDRSNGR